MNKPILQHTESNEVLRKKCRELNKEEILSNEIQALILEMKQIMQDAPGVGLAAPQIGISLQLAVIEDPEERLKQLDQKILAERQRKPVAFHVIINPKIISLSGKTNYFFEGCLSINEPIRIVPRKETIHIQCLNEKAEVKEITASGWYARILQHEIDHLNGKLNIDISDVKTGVPKDEYLTTWMTATSGDILKFYHEKCDKE